MQELVAERVSLISRLSVFTVTRKRSLASGPTGCSAIDGAAPTCTFDDGHISRGTRGRARTPPGARARAPRRPSVWMSSMMPTPCPRRSAPHTCSASAIDGRPNASPAWIVMWKSSRITREKASRWRAGGSRPRAGDVEAAHALVAVAQRQLRDLQASSPAGASRSRDAARSARGPAEPRPKPASTASTTSSSDRPVLGVQLGGEADLGVDDAVVGEVLGALGGHPLQRLRVCITPPCGRTSPGRARGRCGWRRGR